MVVVVVVNGETATTHLLELKLSPPADIGVGIECRDDAALNRSGIHRG